MKNRKLSLQVLFDWLVIFFIFLIGFWLIIIRPLGPNLSRLPGDLGDTRFNNYILEHDFRWITGQDSSLWNLPAFYLYPQTLTFSDNHLGSMLFYASFRWFGLDRESAMQGWYLLSYILNFGAAAYVLMKIKLKPMAIGLGAFFFTYGFPVLAQEGHEQLAYRFCIPFACYALWQFSQKVQFKNIVLTMFWLVWQFYLSIYLGFFLALFLLVLAVGLPFTQNTSLLDILKYWPGMIKQAWKNSKITANVIYLLLISMLTLALFFLFKPYVLASKTYGFSRSWQEVSTMLPRIQSYLIADNSKLWQPFAYLSAQVTAMRWEHQMFIGVAPVLLLILGLVWHFKSPNRKIAFLFFGAAGFLVLLTLDIGGFSLYKILWYLPGVNSVRAVTRIILLLMWPVALFISIVVDALLKVSNRTFNYSVMALIILGLMITESVFINHYTYLKTDSYSRLQTLRKEIPANIPEDPVLFVWNPDDTPWFITELDAMLLSQDLGWPVMNGYSGNVPEGYGQTKSCEQAVVRIIRYMNFDKIQDPSFYKNLISRVVSVGPEECQWPKEVPVLSLTNFSGPFSQELFSGISIKILSLTKQENNLYIQIDVENHSSQTLPAESATGNPFRISWRMIDAIQGNPMSGFDPRIDLFSDIPAGGHSLMTIIATPPTGKGEYRVEVSAVQEGIVWFHDRGMLPARSIQTINVDNSGQWTISN